MKTKIFQKFKNFVKNLFNPYKYSELGQLGNLSNYSLSEIKQSLKKMRFEEIKIDKFIFLHVSDKHTEYILKYNQNGVLIKIEKDEWK